MVICKDCNTPMIGVMSFSKDKHERFCRCPKCYSETKHNRIKDDTKIATQAHSFRCGLVSQQYKLFNKLNYIFNFTMEIFTYAI